MLMVSYTSSIGDIKESVIKAFYLAAQGKSDHIPSSPVPCYVVCPLLRHILVKLGEDRPYVGTRVQNASQIWGNLWTAMQNSPGIESLTSSLTRRHHRGRWWNRIRVESKQKPQGQSRYTYRAQTIGYPQRPFSNLLPKQGDRGRKQRWPWRKLSKLSTSIKFVLGTPSFSYVTTIGVLTFAPFRLVAQYASNQSGTIRTPSLDTLCEMARVAEVF